MGKVVATEFVSLDGVFENSHKLHFPSSNDAIGRGRSRPRPSLWDACLARNGPPTGRSRDPT